MSTGLMLELEFVRDLGETRALIVTGLEGGEGERMSEKYG